MKEAVGKVYLVGAGPGDPGLMTIKGRKLVEQADVVVYDRLVGPRILEYISEHAEKIYVGKAPDHHSVPQEQIEEILIDRARKNSIVVRLKGGDPFVFGRGGEEAEALVAAGIPFEVVPGITSAISAPAYAGIPVTHRGLASSVAIVTGHEDPSKEESAHDWSRLATATDTLVVLMGVGRLATLVDTMIAHGRDPDTPAALIQWGTTPRQRTVVAPLSQLPQAAKEAGIGSPAAFVVGDVAQLSEEIAWWEQRPLYGRQIVVTRARAQASTLVERLEQLGAETLEMPTIRILPPKDDGPLHRAVRNASTYRWFVFTSVNAVDAFFSTFSKLGHDIRSMGSGKIAAVGEATARRLMERGLLVDLVPSAFHAEALVDAFKEVEISEEKILVPRSDRARPALIQGLKDLGAEVDEVVAYENVAEPIDREALERVARGEVDAVTFTSSSTVSNFAAGWREAGLDWPPPIQAYCIGPMTAQSAKFAGLDVKGVAKPHNIDGLVQLLLDEFASSKEVAN